MGEFSFDIGFFRGKGKKFEIFCDVSMKMCIFVVWNSMT